MVKTFYISILSKFFIAKALWYMETERERDSRRETERKIVRERGREDHCGNQKS